MADDQQSADDEWAYSEVLPRWQLIEYLFDELKEAESPEEHRSICARLIRGARYLDEAEIGALAQAVENGPPKRRRGQPARTKRDREIRHLLMFGHILPGRREWNRADFIGEIASTYGMNWKTAEAAYDKANGQLKAEADAGGRGLD